MGAGHLLRDLDSRMLPPMARRMSRLADGPGRMRLLTGVALLSATAVLITTLWTIDRTAPGGSPTPALIRVGVVEGQSVPGYVRNSRGELATLLQPPAPGAPSVGETYALVTFSAYFAPDRLKPLLGGAAVAEVYVRALLTGLPTQVLRIPANRVPDDVLAGMREAARRRDREQADYAQLAADAADGDQRLRRAYDNAALAAAAEAIAYRAECSCVFAAVVRATPAGLEQIARRVGVRAVDPAPEVDALDRVEFNPPQPEQQTTVIESSPPVAPLLPAPVLTPRLTHPSASPTGTPPSPSPSATPPSTSSEPPAPESEPTDAATPERTDVPSALPVSPSATTPS